MTKAAALGAVVVSIDGTDWTLIADFNAMCDFEVETGLNAMEFMERFETGESGAVTATHLRAFVFAMLKQSHDDATVQDAGTILSRDPDALMRAFAAAFPTPDDDAGGGDLGSGKKTGTRG